MATAGYTNIGANTYMTGNANNTNWPGLKITLPVAGSITKITAHVANTVSSNNTMCKLYSDVAGLRVLLLATTNNSTVTTSFQWLDFTFASPYSALATDYWLEFDGDGGNGPGGNRGQIKYDTGGGANTSYTLNDTGIPIYGTDQFSIYATYSPTATDGFNIALV